MEEMKDKLKPVRELVQKFINMEKLLCSLMLVIMVVITFTQVVMRFIFNAPFSWVRRDHIDPSGMVRIFMYAN